jgi:hypothetical protein
MVVTNQYLKRLDIHGSVNHNRGCPIRYRTRHFFNDFTTNEDIATKFEADLPYCIRNVTTTNVFLFKFRCNIFIGVRIIKEMPGSVPSGTLYINLIEITNKMRPCSRINYSSVS